MIHTSTYFFARIGFFHAKSGTFPFIKIPCTGKLLSSYTNSVKKGTFQTGTTVFRKPI